jgi:capsular exopolysaccharide synthesis family protein
MERIKQALERARQEREKNQGSAVLKWTAQAKGAEPDGKRKISYTTTQRVGVSRDLLRSQRIFMDGESGPVLDIYRILRTRVLQRMRANGWSTLAVTSPGSGEGKTLTAINLAISLSMEVSWTVLLVDANLRRPSVHQFFGIKSAYGLSDYLTGDASIEQILMHPGIDSFVILPGGKPLPNGAELLGSPQMGALVNELKDRYASRIVLFDIPPLLSSAEALAFLPHVDAVLLVAEEGKTLSTDLTRAIALLKDKPMIGTVLNKMPRMAAASA